MKTESSITMSNMNIWVYKCDADKNIQHNTPI